MGTSASSPGPGPGVPFDPPWLDDIPEPKIPGAEAPQGEAPETDDPNAPLSRPLDTSEIAPPSRFKGARTSFGNFARNGGGREAFGKAAGHYSQTGMGGASRVASRMRSSTKTGAALAKFLGQVSQPSTPETTRWVESIVAKDLSANEVIDEIIKQLTPNAGSLDEESCADSMAQAMHDFLDQHDSNLLELSTEEIQEITELFITNEAYNRLLNDCGQVFEKEATLSPREQIELKEEMHSYLYSDISAEMGKLWVTNPNPTQAQLNNLLQDAIHNTFNVYESEL